MRLRKFAFEAALMLLVAGCGEQSGPVEIKYDRDVCEMCGMIISTPRYVAEVRLADGKIHKFDDIGDVVTWLEKNCVAPEQAREIWVMNSQDGRTWLDARRVFFARGLSPMNYNFAAVPKPGDGAVDFAAMRASILRPNPSCAKTEREK